MKHGIAGGSHIISPDKSAPQTSSKREETDYNSLQEAMVIEPLNIKEREIRKGSH